MKKNGIFTFIFALVPGCGQMYQGYMKRGLSLMFWFCAVIAVSVLTHVYVLMVLLPVVWAYSFFDSFNLRSLSEQQRAVFADSFIPDAKWLNDTGMEKWVKGIRFGKAAGWVCVGIGVLILYGNMWDVLYSTLWHYTPVLAYWMDRLPGIVIAVVVILLGVRMLRQRQRPDTQDAPPAYGQDAPPPFQGYTPPQPAAPVPPVMDDVPPVPTWASDAPVPAAPVPPPAAEEIIVLEGAAPAQAPAAEVVEEVIVLEDDAAPVQDEAEDGQAPG